MNNTFVKSIVVGALVGVAFFMMPFFLIRAVLFIAILGGLFRLLGGRRLGRRGWGRGYGRGYMPAFADQIRQMSDEEYNQFKQRYSRGYCGGYAEQNPAKSAPNTDSTTTL